MAFVCVFSLGSDECVARDFGHGSVVCECNSTHCDSVGPGSLPGLGQFVSYLTSKAGSRLEKGQGRVLSNSSGTGEALDPSRYTKSRRMESVAPTFLCIYLPDAFIQSDQIKSGVTCVALVTKELHSRPQFSTHQPKPSEEITKNTSPNLCERKDTNHVLLISTVAVVCL